MKNSHQYFSTSLFAFLFTAIVLSASLQVSATATHLSREVEKGHSVHQTPEHALGISVGTLEVVGF